MKSSRRQRQAKLVTRISLSFRRLKCVGSHFRFSAVEITPSCSIIVWSREAFTIAGRSGMGATFIEEYVPVNPKETNVSIQLFDDPLCMPGTGESAEERYARAVPLEGTAGQIYVERRGVPVDVADCAGVRFDVNFAGRPAVLAPMRDEQDNLASLHGRYLHNLRGQNKMLTIGGAGGVVSVLGGWRVEPLILVEGLFDALSLATCGWASIATIGRWAPWLPEVVSRRAVWLAFDAGRPGEEEVLRYSGRLRSSEVRRLLPPPRCKDWSTALAKRGPAAVSQWVHQRLTESLVTQLASSASRG